MSTELDIKEIVRRLVYTGDAEIGGLYGLGAILESMDYDGESLSAADILTILVAAEGDLERMRTSGQCTRKQRRLQGALRQSLGVLATDEDAA
jgi:hypothetical protein